MTIEDILQVPVYIVLYILNTIKMNQLALLESEFVEVDPTGRYGRYKDVLGRGASKTVYRAFDEYEGIEVAWNQIKLYDFLQSPEDLERLAVKHWCRQILKGLVYLHSHEPPVIHRDLKCDNIFVNGNQGVVKIGDLGLAAILRKSNVANCVGTPEFMAPEVYEEEYNELIDIYSFGMCILEMITFEYPYSECTSCTNLQESYLSALYKVKNPEVRRFIEKCLVAASRRLSARELLNDPFLRIDNYEETDDISPLFLYHPNFEFRSNTSSLNGYTNDFDFGLPLEHQNSWEYNPIENERSGIELFNYHDDEKQQKVDITIKGKKREDGGIFLRLRITDKEGRVRNIYFPFDIETDTALGVATEMVAELDITDHDETTIAYMIDKELASLVPDWKLEENRYFGNANFCENCASNRSSIELEILQCSTNGCAAMRGRFGEITSQVEGSEPAITAGNHGHDNTTKYENTSDKDSVSFADYSEPNTRSSSPADPSPSCEYLDNNENEIRQEFRWLKAMYQMELRDLKYQQIVRKSEALIKVMRNHFRGSSYSSQVHREKNKLFCNYSLRRSTSLLVDAIDV
ncbi:hypothetical protein MKW92_027887 [Papaver armeniacum]|nr:hypothetical protein MKW92_027887 [Papaver armeniacum]